MEGTWNHETISACGAVCLSAGGSECPADHQLPGLHAARCRNQRPDRLHGHDGGISGRNPSPLSRSQRHPCPFLGAVTGLPDDGCAGAHGGAPPLASLLATYGTKRPKWNVAGVDYYVGNPSGTALKDPATASIKGCTYANAELDCAGSGIIVTGLVNFSGIHGGTKLSAQHQQRQRKRSVGSSSFALAQAVSESRHQLHRSLRAKPPAPSVASNSFDGGAAKVP